MKLQLSLTEVAWAPRDTMILIVILATIIMPEWVSACIRRAIIQPGAGLAGVLSRENCPKPISHSGK